MNFVCIANLVNAKFDVDRKLVIKYIAEIEMIDTFILICVDNNLNILG